MSYIVNPEAVGDPDQTPMVALPPEVVEAMRTAGVLCACGGLSGYHTEECPKRGPVCPSCDRLYTERAAWDCTEDDHCA